MSIFLCVSSLVMKLKLLLFFMKASWLFRLPARAPTEGCWSCSKLLNSVKTTLLLGGRSLVIQPYCCHWMDTDTARLVRHEPIAAQEGWLILIWPGSCWPSSPACPAPSLMGLMSPELVTRLPARPKQDKAPFIYITSGPCQVAITTVVSTGYVWDSLIGAVGSDTFSIVFRTPKIRPPPSGQNKIKMGLTL